VKGEEEREDGRWKEAGGYIQVLRGIEGRAFQFGPKKTSIRFDSRYRYRIDFFDSIRQSDKFAACTQIVSWE